jgi:choline dehydrogenase-like flavoprotein
VGTLRSPAILARSGLDHPALGRHLRLHPVSIVAGVMDEDVVMWEGTPQGACSLQHLGDGDGDRGGFTIESAPGTPGLMALVLPWEGRAAFTSLMGRARRIAPILAIVREHGAGRVTTTRAGRVRIDYALGAADRAQLQAALAVSARIARAAGAREMVAVGTPPSWFRAGADSRDAAAFPRYLEDLARFPFSPNRGTVVSAHQMGTVRAGGDPGGHPCDPWGRVRANGAARGRDATVPGLWVADASLFPTSLGVNPMLTTMVLARRVARAIRAETTAG